MNNGDTLTVYPSQPERHVIAPIAAYVQVEHDDWQERWQSYDDHIETEIRT